MQEKKWYSIDTDELCRDLNTSAGTGLEAAEAANRLRNYGPNVLQENRRAVFYQFSSAR